MTQVSKYLLPKEVYDHIFDVFLSTFVEIRTKNSASEFLGEFLTPTEKIMLAKRLAIGILVAKKCDYRKISQILKVSTATVGNISSLYKYGRSYKKMVDKLLTSEETKKFWVGFGEEIASIADIGGAKAVGWKELKLKLRNKRLSNPF
ncbi:MAG: Trp family transcriptional regulator [Candidatus Woesebacteria bacterium]|nr:Trp family transcriptional regulator [Candidatus Woesebacteria bacterium]